jgi:UDPglucose 6-dehydrogenase
LLDFVALSRRCGVPRPPQRDYRATHAIIDRMKIAIVGTGYVGLVTGACFSEMGYHVVCVDSNATKIKGLKEGVMPIHEPDLEQMVTRNYREGRLEFATSINGAAADADVYFIAVGTPPEEDGTADLTHVLEVARQLGREMRAPCIVVDKSTVPVGTADKVRALIQAELDRRKSDLTFDVVSNPEFLKEGAAVNDFMHPDRVIIGADNERAAEVMHSLYVPFLRKNQRIITMGVRDAEMTKYAANAMLATKISFMNEIANVCERLGVDVENVRLGIGADSRIGYSFIYPGCGYGGACFPKDVRALVRTASDSGVEPMILKAVEMRNQSQKQRLFEKITTHFGPSLEGRVIALWGLAFKPDTDDMREAPSVDLLKRLMPAGARVRAYDPVAMDTARRILPADWFSSGRLTLVEHQNDALAGADALALLTEWKQFRHLELPAMRAAMKKPVIFDGRNQYDPAAVRSHGFEYYGMGR